MSLARPFVLLINLSIALLILGCGPAGTSETAPQQPKNLTATASQSPTPSDGTGSKSTTTPAPHPFSKTLELFGIKFVIESPNTATGNKLTVTPSGLEKRNDTFTRSVDGEVYEAEIGDLNMDESPEVYVYYRLTSENKRSSVIGYAANSKKSMSEFALRDPDPKSKEYTGYNGWDEFAVVENVLSRRFPLYEVWGADMKPTGRMRVVQYKIAPGENTWKFVVHRTDEF